MGLVVWDPVGNSVARRAGQLFPQLKSHAAERPTLYLEHLFLILEQQEASPPLRMVELPLSI